MDLILLAPVGSLLALIFAGYLAFSVFKHSEGNDTMKHIAQAIRQGANAYLKRQYTILSFQGYLVIFVPFAFISGGFFSGLAGFIGMKVATGANARTANAPPMPPRRASMPACK